MRSFDKQEKLSRKADLNYSKHIGIKDKTEKKSSSNTNNQDNISRFGIFKLVILLILIIVVVRSLLGSETIITFAGFLNFISEVPQVDISQFTYFDDLTITADWGIFNFFRSFINIFSGALGVVVFFIGGIIQAVLFLVYFIGFLFAV